MTEKPPRPNPTADLFEAPDANQAGLSTPGEEITGLTADSAHAGQSPQQALTPASLNRLARQTVEHGIGRVWITGEVTGFSRHPSSGHCYFSLKDAQASVSCAWFRRQIRPGQTLKNGICA